jgi:hypothetical protein
MVLWELCRAGSTAGKAGVFDRMLHRLQAKADARGALDWDLHFVDATVVRAHQHAGPAPLGGEGTVEGVGEALGRSPGGFSTKLHLRALRAAASRSPRC